MKKKLWATLKMHAGAHKFITGTIALVLLILVWQFAGGLIQGARNTVTSLQTNSSESQAGREVKQATEAQTSANNTATDRKAEDLYRERALRPEVERTRRSAEEARTRARSAEVNYEQAKKNSNRSRLDRDSLHRRNCADLRELYPGEFFPGCDER